MSWPEAKKSLGQHWLDDPSALQNILYLAEVSNTDTILEIGPGTGALTGYLLQTGASVVAVEIDSALAKALEQKYTDQNLRVITGSILTFDFSSLPANYKIVANIPYYLTSHLIRLISETPNQPLRVVLLVQKEVAERVAAQPGDMSLLSITAQFYWEVSLGPIIPAQLFNPKPKVDSQVLICQRRKHPLYPDIDSKSFFRLVKAGFSARRKKLRSSLSGGLRLEKSLVEQKLKNIGIDPNNRAQSLSIADWYKIYNEFNS